MTKILDIKDLKLHYPIRRGLFRKPDYVRAVDGVTLQIAQGEIVGLVGESGCGKSSLGRVIVRLEDPTAGSVEISGVDIATLKGKKLRIARKDFQMIFQDPYGSLNPRLTIESALDEVLRLHDNSDSLTRHARAVALMEMVGLTGEQLSRYPHQFSGGQRQRIGIARALATNPKLIVADEPVSALDVSVQAQIINLLGEIRQETKTSFLFIAHDLAVVEHISDRILVMYLGKIVEEAEAHELCANPQHPYTEALLSAVPKVDVNGVKRIMLEGDVPSPLNPPSGCAFHPRCPRAQECCRKNSPTLDGDAHKTACFFPKGIKKI